MWRTGIWRNGVSWRINGAANRTTPQAAENIINGYLSVSYQRNIWPELSNNMALLHVMKYRQNIIS